MSVGQRRRASEVGVAYNTSVVRGGKNSDLFPQRRRPTGRASADCLNGTPVTTTSVSDRPSVESHAYPVPDHHNTLPGHSTGKLINIRLLPEVN